MKRVMLFLATNLAILVVLSITLWLLGVDRILDARGVDLDLKALLVFAAVFGMGGSFISLARSKWTAKRFTSAQVIEQPSNPTEQWLVEMVRRQARADAAVHDPPAHRGADRAAAARGLTRTVLTGARDSAAVTVRAIPRAGPIGMPHTVPQNGRRELVVERRAMVGVNARRARGRLRRGAERLADRPPRHPFDVALDPPAVEHAQAGGAVEGRLHPARPGRLERRGGVLSQTSTPAQASRASAMS